MQIVIKNPAPLGNRLKKWGDYHFGASLAAAIERERPEVEVRQDYWPEWERNDEGDFLIVLRGKRPYRPSGRVPAFLWVMSHPSTVVQSEIQNYLHILAGSQVFYDFVKNGLTTPVSLLRQCTDTNSFTQFDDDIEEQIESRIGTVFVANSRGFRRDMLHWAIEAGIFPKLIGGQWDKLGLAHLVQKEFFENEELPALYRRSRFSLNDHWADMRYFGIINNRILDCLACGLPVITDRFPELEEQFGDVLLFADGPAPFFSAYQQGDAQYRSLLERISLLRNTIENEYSFDVRARQIFELIDHYGRAGAGPLFRKPFSSSKGIQTSTLTEQLVKRYFSKTASSVKKYRILHLFPTLQINAVIEENDERFSYFSGGFGTGPWQLSLIESLEQIEGMNFDVILIDSLDSLDDIQPLRRHRFLRGISRALAVFGVLVLQRDRLESDWKDWLAHAGFIGINSSKSWALFRPQASITAETETYQIASYARTLEFRLNAIYKSSTWKVMEPVRKMSALVKRRKVPAAPIPERPSAVEGKDPLVRWRTK
jgi:hypothetical protein